MNMKLTRLLLDPNPFRSAAIDLMRRFEIGSYERRLEMSAVERPHYGYCIYNAAVLAKRLGYERISVIEFGVAGGNGLLSLERHAYEVSRLLSIGVEIYGFDTGEGLPEPQDYRDLPYHWKKGFFRMDVDKLRSRLSTAKLVLGDVRETAKTFFQTHNPAPIAAVMHDFDFYSSTVAALKIFDVDNTHYLPRVYCYFDDIVGNEGELYSDYTGERLAIREFNDAYRDKKLSPAYHLLSRLVVEPWFHQIFIFHDFKHPSYTRFVSDEQSLALDD